MNLYDLFHQQWLLEMYTSWKMAHKRVTRRCKGGTIFENISVPILEKWIFSYSQWIWLLESELLDSLHVLFLFLFLWK